MSRLLPLMLLCLVLTAQAQGAQRTLLTLGGIRQWVDVDYSYDSNESEQSGGQSSHSLGESYNLSGKYAILHPNLWVGDYLLELGLDQDWNRDRSGRTRRGNALRHQYELSGLLFSKKPTSASFLTRSATERHDVFNAPTYDVETDTYAFKVNLKNRLLPARISYRHSTSTTDGLAVDRTVEIDTLRIEARHSVGRSDTEGSADFDRLDYSFHPSDVVSAPGGSNAASFNLSNRYELRRQGRPAALSSQLGYRTEQEGRSASGSRSWSLGQGLGLPLGRALNFSVNYGLSRFEDDQPGGDRRTRQAAAALQHRLFSSLMTSLRGSGTHQESSFGEQVEYGGSLGFEYTKRVGNQDTLALNGSYGIALTDRDLSSQFVSARDVRLTVQTVDNFLPDPDITAGSVVVRNADRTLLYVEGIDYLLQTVGRLTEVVIPFGSVVAIGDVLSVDYQYEVDPSERFVSRTRRIGGSYSLSGGALVLFADLSQVDYELRDGDTRQQRFNDSLAWSVGLSGRRQQHSYRLAYRVVDDQVSPQRSLEGEWVYRRKLLRGWWSLQARDSYVWYQASAVSGLTSEARNNLTLSSSLSQSWGYQQLDWRLAFTDSRGRSGSLYQAITEAEYTYEIGKTRFSLSAGMRWREEDRWSRSERVDLKIRRYL